MNGKNFRNRILPMILATALVVSDAGYGSLPIVYAEGTEKQVQDDGVDKVRLDAEEQEIAEKAESVAEESVAVLEEENEQNAATEEDPAEAQEIAATDDEAAALEEEVLAVSEKASLTEQEITVTELDETVIEEKEEQEDVQETDPTASGDCGANGANVTWKYYDDTKTFIISGSGEMWDNSSAWESYKSKITTIVIANGITKIGGTAFSGCTNLTTIEIPNTVTSIGYSAFQSCTALQTINIPDSVTSIGNGAFMSSGLTELKLNHSIEIGRAAFSECKKLSTVDITCNNTIGESAFAKCTTLMNVTINGKVTSIGNYAFGACKELKTVKIPNGSSDIFGNPGSNDSDGAFRGCTNLETLEIPNGAGNIGPQAFRGCTNLSSIKIAASAQTIGANAFTQSGLTTIEFVERTDALTIGEGAFSWCSKLTDIAIPAKTTVGVQAFYNTKLTSVTVGDDAVIEDAAFWESKVQTVTLGQNVTLKKQSFTYCPIKKIVISSGSEIGEQAFQGCSSLAEVTIEDGVSSIEASAFSGCTSLKSIELPESIKTINSGAFSGCSNLENVIIQGKQIGILGTPFSNCSKNLTLLMHKGSNAAAHATTNKIPYKYIVEKIAFTPDSETLKDLEEGAEAQITLQLLPTADDSTEETDSIPTVAGNITWTIDDNAANVEIITAPESGEDEVTATIKGVQEGECTITVSCDGLEASCNIKVVKRVLPVTFSPEGGLLIDQSVTLQCETEGATIYYTIDGTEPTKNSSEYKEPITLENDATIKAFAVKTGYLDGKMTEMEYTVSKVTGLSFEKDRIEIDLGETAQLSVHLAPEDTAAKTPIEWESSDPEIVSIENDSAELGNTTVTLKANMGGTCYITASCEGKDTYCTVNVIRRVAPARAETDPAVDSNGKLPVGAKVILSTETEGAFIYYVMDSDDDIVFWGTKYTQPIVLNEPGTHVIRVAVGVSGDEWEGWEVPEEQTFTFIVAESSEEVALTGIKLDNTTLELGQEESRQLTVSFLPENATPQTVTWNSSDSSVASVEKNNATTAKVTAKKAGTCTITASCGTFTATCNVTVTNQKRVSQVYADPAAGEVTQGTEVALKCDTEDAKIYYTLDGSVPSTASTLYTTKIPVDKAMTIKAIAVKDGYENSEAAELSYTIKKEPEEIAITGIKLDVETLQLGQEESRLLTVSFLPENATPKTVTWTSSDSSVASVEHSSATTAKVMAKKAGTCTITATCGTFTATCNVTVTNQKRVSQVYADPAAGEVTQGTEVALKCDTQDAKIYYTLDGSVPSTASTLYTTKIPVDKSMTIKAIAVKDDYQDSEVAELSYTIKKEPEEIAITGIKLDAAALQLGQEESRLLTVSFLPTNATPQKIAWTCDKTDIASVEANDSISARVTGKAAGTCTITATCGTFIATCQVTVTGEKRVSQVYSVPAAGSVVTPGTEVSLYCNTAGAKIYYTLDGSVPTVRSTPYTRPLSLNEDTVIRAIAVKEDYEDSAIAELSFTVNAIIPDLPDIDPTKKGIWVTTISKQPYTGSAIKPAFYVYDGNKLLQEKTDYTVSYKNNTNLGNNAQIIITGKGNYADKKTVSFEIVQRSISDQDVIIEDMAYAFDGKLHKSAPVITHNGKKLKEGKDFTVDFGTDNYINEGIYEVSITGKGNYTGTAKGKIAIVGRDNLLSKAFIAAIPEQKYNNGMGVTLKDEVLQVRIGGKSGRLLQKDKDYVVSYANNVNPGKATVIIKGINSYAGTKKATFKIAYAAVMMNEVQCSNYASFKNMDFVKGGCMPQPILVYNGYQLKTGTDYTFSYKDNKKVGPAKLVLNGKGRFKGKHEISFNIEKKNISGVAMRTLNVPYTGKANKYQSKPILTDTDGTILKEGTDYTLTYLYNKTELDKKANPPENAVITVNVEGKGSYSGSRTDTYALKGTSFSAAKITVKNQVYTGKAIVLSEKDIQSATIKVSGMTENLRYGVDYEIVSYSKNIKKGTATVVFGGIGKYSGEKAVKFKIVNRNINADQ